MGGEVEPSSSSSEAQEPLLLDSFDDSKTTTNICILTKCVLKVLLWIFFAMWIILVFILPVEWFYLRYHDWYRDGTSTFYGIEGRVFLVYSSPVVILTILASAYLIVSKKERLRLRSKEEASYKLWTFPIIVDGLLGVVSVAELIGIFIFFVFIFWSLINYKITTTVEYTAASAGNTEYLFYYSIGISLGSVGLFTMAFCFLPVSRGSALLRLINVPFEHAVKYHIWVANVTLVLLTLHGIIISISYVVEGKFKDIFAWENETVANLAGVIAMLFGFAMWITSIKPIRQKYFESFFYTHQLYVFFLFFTIFHVGEIYFCLTIGMIFIFTLDRFLRFCQSRTIVGVVSAKYHPCGVIELALAKPIGLRYNALSFIFLRIREVSCLQWHPFSVSTSPLDGKNDLSIMIKVGGEWTMKLKDRITSTSTLTASVEGPYGYEQPYYIEYGYLILVAGGIGISPFLAILRDILHRTAQSKPCMARNILIVWAVKKSNELSLYFNINDELNSICPSFPHKLSLEARIHVTQETAPTLEEGHVNNIVWNVHDSLTSHHVSSKGDISNLVGTGNSKWLAIYVLASTIGFLIIKGLMEQYYINVMGVKAWWYKDILLVGCMVASVVVLGGFVVVLWHLRESRARAGRGAHTGDRGEVTSSFSKTIDEKGNFLRENAKIDYGSRPDLKRIFESMSEDWGNVDVGTIVCGPESLESSVAKACRTVNFARKKQDPIFHFHSHSFSL